MPGQFLTDSERERLASYPEDIPEDIYRYEEGYQKVRVLCVIDRRLDDSWKVVGNN